MKKTLLFIIVLLMLLTVSSCTQKDADSDNELTIISTVFAPFDFARSICPENADVSMLLSPGVDVHAYEPTPKDIIAIQSCDLFIYIGGESDEWVETMLDSMEDVRTLKLMDYVNTLDEELVEGMESDDDEEGGEPDEHIWTSPKNAEKIVSAISVSLCEIVPENQDEIKNKTDDYIAQLEKLDTYIRQITEKCADPLLIFADRFPMRYFTEEYGISYYAAFPGCSSNTEPSASSVAFLIDKVNEYSIPAVLYTEFSNQKMADTICEATNAEKLCMHSCHNVSSEDFENQKSYIDLMYNNANVLSQALK